MDGALLLLKIILDSYLGDWYNRQQLASEIGVEVTTL